MLTVLLLSVVLHPALSTLIFQADPAEQLADFNLTNDGKLLISSPSRTLLLNESQDGWLVESEHRKHFSSVIVLFFHEESVFECGERITGPCCYLFDLANLAVPIASNDSSICNSVFTLDHAHTSYGRIEDGRFTLIHRFYLPFGANVGRSRQLYYPNIFEPHSNASTRLVFAPYDFNSYCDNTKPNKKCRPYVISPSQYTDSRFIVHLFAKNLREAWFVDIDFAKSVKTHIQLTCGSCVDQFSAGTALDLTGVSAGALSAGLTHLLLCQSGTRALLCAYSEADMATVFGSMTAGSQGKMAADSLRSIEGATLESLLEGMVVNGALVLFYTVGNSVHKLTMADSMIKIGGTLFTASSPVKKLQFPNETLGYALTENSIESFWLHNCESRMNCGDCLSLQDPHCGWCTLENRCSAKSDCTVYPDFWYQDSSQCLVITLPPTDKDVIAGTQLTLDVSTELPVDSDYLCKFEGSTGTYNQSPAVYNSDLTISCPVPEIQTDNKGLLVVTLNIGFRDSTLGSTTINYHHCNRYTECGECSSVAGAYKYCTWCPLEGSCNSHSSAPCNEYKVTNSSLCPAVRGISPARIPRDTINAEVLVTVENLPALTVSNVFQCRLSSRENASISKKYEISADSTNTTIRCMDVQVDSGFPEYHNGESEMDLSIVYKAGPEGQGVDVGSGTVSVYSCELLASDCVSCVASFYVADYSCRFCGDLCHYKDHPACEKGDIKNRTQCLERDTRIQQIDPSWSPGEGGVTVTLRGKSLSINSFKVDVKFIFPVAGMKIITCDDTTYTNSTMLTCRTPDIWKELAPGIKDITANVSLSYTKGGNTAAAEHMSDYQFNFTSLSIDEVVPSYGPASGGTTLTVNGTRICVEGQTEVTVDGKPCTETRCDTAKQELQCKTPANTEGSAKTNVVVTLGGGSVTKAVFDYGRDPVVTGISPNCTFAQGGINLTVSGSDFHMIQDPLLLLTNSTCSDAGIVTVPAVRRSETQLVYTLPQDTVAAKIGFRMDNVASVCETDSLLSLETLPPPTIISSDFDENNSTQRCYIGGDPCTVSLKMTQIHRFPDQVVVQIGASALCANMTINQTVTTDGVLFGSLLCYPPSLEEVRGRSDYEIGERVRRALLGDEEMDRFRVVLRIGHYQRTLGSLSFVEKSLKLIYIYIAAGAVGMVLLVFIFTFVMRSRNEEKKRGMILQQHEKELNAVEVRYTEVAKRQFVMTMMDSDVDTKSFHVDPHDIPFRVFRDYLIHCIFPSVDTRKILNNLQLEQCEYPEEQIARFKQCLNDEQFVKTFITVIESQRDFLVPQRCNVASYLTIALYSDFNYLSRILFLLLDRVIDTDIQRNAKLLLRQTKSVAEKLLTNWLSLALYDYLCNSSASALYNLCNGIMRTVESGPIDCVTHQACYALSQDKILSESVDHHKLSVKASGPDGSTPRSGYVTLLDCDTITQAKGKLYRAIYPHQPYSQQPHLDSLTLLWTPANSVSSGAALELSDTDEQMSEGADQRTYNMLATYKVQSNDMLALTMFDNYHPAPMSTIRSVKRRTVTEDCRIHLVRPTYGMDFRSPAPNKRSGVGNGTNTVKLASEAYLHSLTRTKNLLEGVFDSMMGTIFMESNINNIPPAIKFLFDFLESKRDRIPPDDANETVHIWKMNSLVLRFWVNIMKNPQFLFDMEKPPIMDSFLSTLSQCLIDSFSRSDLNLSENSSANKLNYNKEVHKYRRRVLAWYSDVMQAPTVTLRQVVQESRLPPMPFRTNFAVSQLFHFALKYREEISEALPQHGSTVTRSDFDVLAKPPHR